MAELAKRFPVYSHNGFNPLWLPYICSPDLYNGTWLCITKSGLVHHKIHMFLNIFLKAPNKRLGPEESILGWPQVSIVFYSKYIGKKMCLWNKMADPKSQKSLYTPRERSKKGRHSASPGAPSEMGFFLTSQIRSSLRTICWSGLHHFDLSPLGMFFPRSSCDQACHTFPSCARSSYYWS